MTKNEAKQAAARMEAERKAREAARRANEIAAMKAAGVKSAAERDAEEMERAAEREMAIARSVADVARTMQKLYVMSAAGFERRAGR